MPPDAFSEEDAAFSPYARFQAVLDDGLYIGLVIHGLFIGLFYIRQVYALSMVNIGSVLLYIVAILLVKNGRQRPAIYIAWLEILGHAAICTVVLGFETGFHYYILVLMPFIFVNEFRSMKSKVLVALILCTTYILLIYLSDHMGALNRLPVKSVQTMKYINSLICLAMIAGLAHIYSQSVIDGENQLKKSNQELQNALAEVKTLRGILPICSFCKKIRDDKGYWEQVDVYIGEHSNVDISHSICPECMEKHYAAYADDMDGPEEK